MTNATEDPKTFSDVEGTFAEESPEEPSGNTRQVRYLNRHERRKAAKLARLRAKEEALEKALLKGEKNA